MKEEVVHGILLQVTPLSTGDALLLFFTREYGKMTVRARSFEGSKKRRAEIDFFRLLELTIAKGRGSWSLRSATTTSVFLPFQDNYSLNQKGFVWLEVLRWSCPEEKEMGDLFNDVISSFGTVRIDTLRLFDIYFRMKVLAAAGHIDRFDLVRGDVYFEPVHFTFRSRQENDRMVLIKNTTRQLLEWFRRSSVLDVEAKKESLPTEFLVQVEEVITLIERHHLGIE